MNKTYLSHSLVLKLAKHTARLIHSEHDRHVKIYGIPRGGVPVAYLIAGASDGTISVANTPDEADAFVDDLIDSGATAKRWQELWPRREFYVLVDKANPSSPCNGVDAMDLVSAGWLVFPWEHGVEEKQEEGIEDNIRRLLQYIGEDVNRGGLAETPHRVAKAWHHWTAGYGKDPASLLKVFEDGADGCDEMVIVKDIPFYTHCEHHMAPFFGTATVAYIPDGKIVGLSKISRVVDMFARRLQVQERLTNQIADALSDNLQPKGVGVVVSARHLCMESRGICQQGHVTITSALRGVLKDKPEARAEFMALAK
jgi:GTP cyclohydrolase I